LERKHKRFLLGGTAGLSAMLKQFQWWWKF